MKSEPDEGPERARSGAVGTTGPGRPPRDTNLGSLPVKQGWITLSEIARMEHLTYAAARRLAEREHWPMVFKQSAIFVLPSRADYSRSTPGEAG